MFPQRRPRPEAGVWSASATSVSLGCSEMASHDPLHAQCLSLLVRRPPYLRSGIRLQFVLSCARRRATAVDPLRDLCNVMRFFTSMRRRLRRRRPAHAAARTSSSDGRCLRESSRTPRATMFVRTGTVVRLYTALRRPPGKFGRPCRNRAPRRQDADVSR
jgi:hypothetical protein